MYAIRLAASLACLAVGSYQDVKSREIEDTVWAVGGILGAAASAAEIAIDAGAAQRLLHSYLSALPLFAILAAAWRWRLMGEADVLAYLTVAALLPEYGPGIDWILPPVFSTFIYSKLALLLAPAAQLTYNLLKLIRNPEILAGFDEPTWRKFLAMLFLSYSEGHSPYATPAVGLSPDGKKKFKLSAVLSSPYGRGAEGPGWVVPSYPMIPLILAGVVATALFGDPTLAVARCP